MPDVFSLSIPHLRQWSQRQPIDHRIQNEPVEALNQLTTGIAPPRQLLDMPIVIQRSVVLIKEPDPLVDTYLEVRPLVYADRPPVSGQYIFSGSAFVAYPELGLEINDFVGLAWLEREEPEGDEEEGALKQPDASAAICKAYLRQSLWHVQSPIYPERFVVCRAYLDDDLEGLGRLLIAQEVMPSLDEDGMWTGTLEAIDEPVEINVWPTMKASDFGPFFWLPEALNDETTILPLTFWHGVWWLKQRPKRGVSLRRGPLRIVDCQPTETPA